MTESIAAPQSHAEAIRHIVGAANIREAAADDHIDGVQPRWVVEPATSAEIAAVLAFAHASGVKVIPRGGGTKLDWGNPPKTVDIILSTRRLNQVIEHAAGDMTATVQAGCTFETFLGLLAERGQRLAVDPLWRDSATIGGVLATNDSGVLRATFGPLRDHLIGITVALADGTLARSGGKVVKNVAGYDLPKLFIGSFGTLGVITEATFRLYPLAQASETLRFSVPGNQAFSEFLTALSKHSLEITAVQFQIEDDAAPAVDVLIEGLSGAIDAKVKRVTAAAMGSGAVVAEPAADAWTATERLFATPDSCVAKITLLPTEWIAFVEAVSRAVKSGNTRWKLVARAIGVGMIRIDNSEVSQLPADVREVRALTESLGGTLTILRCPRAMKDTVDVWPAVGDSLPLMRRIKQQFDPRCSLNPGRFVGGI